MKSWKSLIIWGVLIVICLMIMGILAYNENKAIGEYNLFIVIKRNGDLGDIVYIPSTGVMYAVSRYGVWTLLVNADGTPMLYEG